MIRFIDLGDQILGGEKEFAWYNTVTDQFLKLSDSQTWSCWKDFVEDFWGDVDYDPSPEDLERFTRLFQWKIESAPKKVSKAELEEFVERWAKWDWHNLIDTKNRLKTLLKEYDKLRRG